MEQARCAVVLAGLHNTMGNYQRGLELGHEAVDRMQAVAPSEWQGWPHYILGDSYRMAGNLQRAREHYAQSLDIFVSAEAETGVTRALIGLGTTCRELGSLEESEIYFNRALERAENHQEPFSTARTLSELAYVRQLNEDFAEALSLYNRSLEIRRERCGDLMTATCLIDLGKLLVSLGQPEEAVARLSEALAFSIDSEHKVRTYSAHEGLAEAYAALGDLENALLHLKEYQRIRDEVTSADAATRLKNLEASLDAAAKEKQAELVMEHNEELRSKNAELARLLKELQDTQEMLIQSEKMASLGQLTAGIAHEIRNPLNFVNNFSALTKDLADELDEAIRSHPDETVGALEDDLLELVGDITANSERILDHGRRAGQIVTSMLVHSRQSGGKKTEVDVNSFVATCVDLAHHGFLAIHEDFEVDVERFPGDKVGSFNVIEEELARVITNILGNAFYAVHEHAQSAGGGFRPRISVRTLRSDGSIELRISDNGPGIDDERKKKVFEPFYTTKPTGVGTGLGLSQSYEIVVERHGGRLSVVDTAGGGATFVVSVPAE